MQSLCLYALNLAIAHSLAWYIRCLIFLTRFKRRFE